MSSTHRELIWVTNNKDSGPGSLRAAIDQGHKYAKQDKAIEIAFIGNFSIKPMQKTNLHQYTINGGDWLINNRATKNITIDGSNQKTLDRVRSLFGINSPEKMDGALYGNKPTRVDITRINLVNNEVKGGATRGSGGSLAAGAAVLHWGGHLTWKDSVIQKNKVSGGIGKSGAAGGNGWYRHGYENSTIVTPEELNEDRNEGFHGFSAGGVSPIPFESVVRPVGLNGLPKPYFSTSGTRLGQGIDRLVTYSVYPGPKSGIAGHGGSVRHLWGVVGRDGWDGRNGRSLGEGGQGGGGGGGGGVAHQDQIYEESNPNVWGSGGKGGNGANGAYGAGGGAGGGGGGNAGTNKVSGLSIFKSWNTSRSATWTAAQSGRGGKGGEWATDGTNASKPYRQNAGSGGKGGDGAALGVFTSFASDTQDSSLKLDNIDFIDNEAKGGKGTGRFRTIFSKNTEVKFNDVTIERNGKTSTVAENWGFKSHHSKNIVHQADGKFKKMDKHDAPVIIHSASYEQKDDAQIAGKEFRLNPNVDNVISLKAYNESKYTQDVEIKGSENLLKALNIINDTALQTESEAEIQKTHKGIMKGIPVIGSFNDGVLAGFVKKEGGNLLKDQATKRITKRWGEGVAKTAKKFVGLIGFGAFLVEGIINQLEEDARIKQELEIKKKIDETRNKVKTLIPDKLSIDPIKVIHSRTNDVFRDFVIGQDQIIFDAGIRPTLKYRADGRIDIMMGAISEKETDNKTTKIGEIWLDEDQHALIAGTVWSKDEYFDTLLHVREFGDHKRYVLAKDTTWNYLRGNALTQQITTSIANDRLIIERDVEGGVKNDEQIKVHTHQGNDRITGDQGNSKIKGGRGNDFIAPGLGIDEVIGGPGFDTVDYSKLDHSITISTNTDDKLEAIINDKGSKLLSKDSLEGVESIHSTGGSNIDLSKAKQPTEGIDLSNLEQRTKGITFNHPSYLIATGSGSQIDGSNFDDIVMISYHSDFNIDPTSCIEQKSTVTKLDGKGGSNILLIDGLSNYLSKGNSFELVIKWNPAEGKLYDATTGIWRDDGKQNCNGILYNTTGGAKHSILTFNNIINRPSFTDFDSTNGWNINADGGSASRTIDVSDIAADSAAANKRVFSTNTITDEDLVDNKFKKIINQKWSIDDDLIDSDDIDWGYLDKISGIEDKMLDYYKNLRFIEKLNPNVVSTLLPELTKGIASKANPLDDEFETGSNEEWSANNDFMASEDTDQKYFNLTEKLNPKTASIFLPELTDYI
ncbi:hypothetical protein PMIT1342_00364 [Prochlorococcus marinus str. MIT 1342]|uniref:hypothetical protein n=1 Tax=Prochlorococcus TaxID=1218 RepID=UPI0007B3B758|nr:hypothetical protein [Prochlorococcus marinus]KZR83572.1 hypothetical protein PMIT1342_00364 [Prochlorococcus marinus str. MIT 1342]